MESTRLNSGGPLPLVAGFVGRKSVSWVLEMAVYSYHPPAPFAKVQCLPYVQPPVSPAWGEGAAGWEGGSGCQLQQAPSSLWPCSWWDPSEHTGSAYARAAWGASNLASGLWIWSPPTALGPGPSHFSILSSISPCVK